MNEKTRKLLSKFSLEKLVKYAILGSTVLVIAFCLIYFYAFVIFFIGIFACIAGGLGTLIYMLFCIIWAFNGDILDHCAPPTLPNIIFSWKEVKWGLILPVILTGGILLLWIANILSSGNFI